MGPMSYSYFALGVPVIAKIEDRAVAKPRLDK